MHSIKPLYEEHEVSHYIPTIIPFLNKALTRSPHLSLDSVLEAVVKGTELLWVIEDDGKPVAVATTQVKQHPNYRTCLLHLCGGTGIDDWMHLLPDIEAWGRGHGCRYVELHGRKGWAKKLPNDYAAEEIIYRKEMNHV